MGTSGLRREKRGAGSERPAEPLWAGKGARPNTPLAHRRLGEQLRTIYYELVVLSYYFLVVWILCIICVICILGTSVCLYAYLQVLCILS